MKANEVALHNSTTDVWVEVFSSLAEQIEPRYKVLCTKKDITIDQPMCIDSPNDIYRLIESWSIHIQQNK